MSNKITRGWIFSVFSGELQDWWYSHGYFSVWPAKNLLLLKSTFIANYFWEVFKELFCLRTRRVIAHLRRTSLPSDECKVTWRHERTKLMSSSNCLFGLGPFCLENDVFNALCLHKVDKKYSYILYRLST